MVYLDIIGFLASHFCDSASLFFQQRMIQVGPLHSQEVVKNPSLVRQRQVRVCLHKSRIDAARLRNGSWCPNCRYSEKDRKGLTVL
ncbi:hypothetical protein D3C72_2425770 [compost metagenome]